MDRLINAPLEMMLQEALKQTTFPDYTFEYQMLGDGSARLRAWYMDECVEKHVMERQNTRWWIVSKHVVFSEIIQTMWKCIMTSKEHFAREHFLFGGRPVFGPHFDVYALWEACERTDVRPGPKPNESTFK